MNKKEAVEQFVERDLSGIPQEWVKIVMEHHDIYEPLPMWGTMWVCNFPGAERLYENARVMAGDYDYLRQILKEAGGEELYSDTEREMLTEALEKDDYSVLEQYVDEEMDGARCILGRDGYTTSLFIYDIEGEYVIGINGAGFNFFDSVWPSLYDAIGLQWHDDEKENL